MFWLVLFMALSVKVGSFNTGTTTANVDVTCGFQPKFVIFWWSGRTETIDTQGEQTQRRGIGFGAQSLSGRSICNHAVHAAATSDTQSAQSDTACVLSVSTAVAIDGAGDLAALANWPADGFRFTPSDAFPISLRVHFLAIGGTDITDFALGTFQLSTTTGTFDITTVGFQPDCVLLTGGADAVAPPVAQTWATFVMGAAVSGAAADQAMLMCLSEDAANSSNTSKYCLTGEVLANVTSDPMTTTVRASFSSFLSNGFRLNLLETGGAGFDFYYMYLAFKGGNPKLVNFTTRTDTTNFDVTTTGITPSAALFVSHCAAQSTADVPQAGDEWSIGAATGSTERAAHGVLEKDAAPTIDMGTQVSHDRCYVNQSTATTIVTEGEMDVVSFSSGKMTLNMPDADPAANFVWSLVVGTTPSESAELLRARCMIGVP